ncbi:MAG: hypothetical protein H7831_15495 [Magnetococcus sp. WYHC-3]
MRVKRCFAVDGTKVKFSGHRFIEEVYRKDRDGITKFVVMKDDFDSGEYIIWPEKDVYYFYQDE